MKFCRDEFDATTGEWKCIECGAVTAEPAARECPFVPLATPVASTREHWATCPHRGAVVATINGHVAGCGCSGSTIEVYQCSRFDEPVIKQGKPPCLDTLREKIPGATGRTCRECSVPTQDAPPPPRSLSDVHRLAFVTSYFNPQRSAARAKNLEIFRQHVKTLGVPLFVVESDSQDAVLWQKERLLNRCIDQLPDAVDAIGWLDADVIFARSDIHETILKALTRWPVIQPWSTCVMLDASGGVQKWNGHEMIRAMAAANNGRPGSGHPGTKHPGFAWAARRDTLAAIGGLYDRHITGSGDTSMVLGFYGDFDSRFLAEDRMSSAMREHWMAWARRAYETVRGQVGFVEGRIDHLYHGEIGNRQYQQRWTKLAAMNFDPGRHVQTAENGSLEWTPDAPRELVEYVADYLLHQRKE